MISEESTTITATDGVKSKTSSPINVRSQHVLNHFEFSPIKSPQIEGVDFEIELKAVDQYGNTFTSYSGTPTLTYSEGSINPSKVSSWTNGVGTAMISIQDTGTGVKITVFDGQATGTSDPFDVNTSSGITLTVEALWTWRLYDPNTIEVTARDQYGNIDTDYIGTVHFTSNDQLASLPQPYTFTPGENGFHRFHNAVILRNITDFSITVTDTETSSITSSITGVARPRGIEYLGWGYGDAVHDYGGLYPYYPEGLYANDLILLHIVGDASFGPSTPTGFTLLYGPNRTGPVNQWIFYRFANGTESGKKMWVPYNGECSKQATLYAFRYVALKDFIEGGGFGSGDDDTILAQSVTTTDVDRLALSFVFVGRPGSDWNEIDVPFYGERGGDWSALYYSGSNRMTFGSTKYRGIALTSALWFAEMEDPGTISGGNYTMTYPASWGVRALALIPFRP